jgi:predicted site-specific integrase-resolvase
MPPVLLNGKELAEQLGVTHAEVMRWHRAEVIPGLKLSDGRTLFVLDKVVAALRARQRLPEPAGVAS